MLNYLWAFMILAGVIYGTVTGNIEAVSSGLIEGGGEQESVAVHHNARNRVALDRTYEYCAEKRADSFLEAKDQSAY